MVDKQLKQDLADDYGFLEDVVQAIKTDYNLEDAEVFEYGYSQNICFLICDESTIIFRC